MDRPKLSQEKLANELGFSNKSIISEIESGKRPPTLRQFHQLATYFNVSPNFLLLGRASQDNDADLALIITQEHPDLISEEDAQKSRRGMAYPTWNPDLWQQIGARIGWLRKRAKMTQDQLAPLIGMKNKAGDLSLIEAGKRASTIFQLLEIAAYFRISSDVLLLGTFAPLNEPHVRDDILRFAQDLIPADTFNILRERIPRGNLERFNDPSDDAA